MMVRTGDTFHRVIEAWGSELGGRAESTMAAVSASSN